MLWWMLQTSVVAAALIVVVAAVCRLGRLRPAVQHALWLVVLLKLATPNVVTWPWSVAEVSERFQSVRQVESAGLRETGPVAHGRAGGMIAGPQDRRDEARTGAVPLRELTEEERQLVQSVLMPEPATAFSGEVGTAGEDQRASGAVSAGLRPPLAVEMNADSPQWGALLIAVWASGAVVIVARQFVRIMRFQRKLHCTRAVPDWLAQVVHELSADLGVRPPRTLVVRDVASPCLWCLGRPLLLWPEKLADDRQAARWRGVIVHELAHLRRRDHWVAWLELAVGCVWWWNPLFWLVRRRLRETADLACDAWAVWMLPDGQRVYAESLLEVTQNMSRMPAAAPVLGAAGGARRSYQRRIEMIMSQRTPCRLPAAGLFGVVLLGLAAAPAWSLDDEPASTTPATAGDLASAETEPAAPPPAGATPARAPSTDPAPASTTANAAQSLPGGGEPLAGTPPPAPTQTKWSEGVPTSADTERIQRLELQVQALIQELRSMHGRNDAPGGAPGGMVWPGVGGRAQGAPAFSPDGKLIAVVTDDGRIAVLEAGTGKEVRRIDLGAPVAAQSLTFNPQGSVLYVGSADGTLSRFDVASGKKLSTTETQHSRPADNPLSRSPAHVPGSAAAPPSSPYGAMPPTDYAAGGANRARSSLFTAAEPAASDPGSLAQSLAGAQIDLIRLATEYTEAAGEKKLAERQLSRIHGLERANAVSEEQVVTAEVQHETASNKLALLRAIAEAAGEATKGELEFAERMAQKGYASPANVAQLKAKLRIIDLILIGGTQPSSEPRPTY